jgi:hypothetical protein
MGHGPRGKDLALGLLRYSAELDAEGERVQGGTEASP